MNQTTHQASPEVPDFGTIAPRRLLRCEADMDFIHCVKIDTMRLSLKTFEVIGEASDYTDEDAQEEFMDETRARAIVSEWVPPGIIYSSPFAGELVRGEHLHDSLEGLVLQGIGEYCIDLTSPWGMFDRRYTKQMITLSANLGYYGLTVADSYTATYIHKGNRNAFQNLARLFTVCQCRLPFADSTMNDAHIRIYSKRPLLLGDSTDTFTVLEGDDLEAYYQGLESRTACDGQPHLRLEGPTEITANGSATCEISMVTNQGQPLCHENVDVYVEAHSGYVPRRKVTLDPQTGRASITVTALGLDAGETMTLKAGFRYYTNAVSHTLQVVQPLADAS